MWTIAQWQQKGRDDVAGRETELLANANSFIQMVADHLQLSGAEVGRLMLKENQRRLAALPDLSKFPELRGMDQLLAARWQGAREQGGFNDAQWAAHCGGHYFYTRHVSHGRPIVSCTSAYFPTSERGPVMGVNLDVNADTLFSEPIWPSISEHLTVGGVSAGVFLDEQSPEIFPVPIWDLVGRYCCSTRAAVDMLTRYNHFWGGSNILIADRQHTVAMIEKTTCRIGVRYSRDGFGFVTAMTAEHPEINTYLADRRLASLAARKLPNPCGDTRYWQAQDARRQLLNELLDDARKHPTVDTMRAMMQFRSPTRGFVADNGEVLAPGDPPLEHTVCTVVFLLAEGRTQWWARDHARNIPSWENRRQDIVHQGVWLSV